MTIGIALPGKIVADWALDLSGVLHPSNKIMRITLTEGKKKSDALLMTAGDSQLTYRFEMAIRGGNLAPEADDLNNDDDLSFEAALVTHRGVTYYDAQYCPADVPWVTIGTGSQYAAALIDTGLDPVEAVRFTCLRIAGCSLMGREPNVEVI